MSNENYKYFYKNVEIKPQEIYMFTIPTGESKPLTLPIAITDEDVVVELINRGVAIERRFETKLGGEIAERMASIPTNLDHYLSSSSETLNNTMGWLKEYFPLELYHMYSKNIALELDKAYSNNIRNCKQLHVIDDFDGKPCILYQKDFHSKDWINLINNVAVFRNEVDLIVCQKILADLRKVVWSGKPKVISE